MGFRDNCKDQASDIIKKLYDLFIKSDCNLIEINPMAEDSEGDGNKNIEHDFFFLIYY